MQEYRKYRITEIEVGYLFKPEGTVDMGTEWAIKRDTTSFSALCVWN